ncbi:MAG: glutamine--fructose-6-phosphate transaminase (isomerizing) [Saprospiraceae bacterium]|nr:glutamine--fructose-6-phosphate transaminase (isomerizing) [Saprospiraceae bacterium]HPG05537.1 glutamine--fructose-6-phosphate transaminase (isomerizing) [Saprospiraceae bacterium]
MCGIVGYIGDHSAVSILLKGLQRLEYRGYDSAGIAVLEEGELAVFKKEGKVANLISQLNGTGLHGSIGIGHTRWATHGVPNDTNAHPHVSEDGKIALIHNGIIENYLTLKSELKAKGCHFQSETDTEVLVQFIADVYRNSDVDFAESVHLALQRVIGAYGLVILNVDEPDQLIAVRKGSPLVIGKGDHAHYIGSDASPFLEYTKEVIYLNDDEIAVVKRDSISITDSKHKRVSPYFERLDLELDAIEKGAYDHFMLKEIFEQPDRLRDCMRGRVLAQSGEVKLGGIRSYADKVYHAKRLILTACGTSYYAGLTAEYLFEDLCRIPVEVEYASEFRYRNPVLSEDDVLVAISQSGETADTLVAVELAKSAGATVLGICNVVGSSIARATHEGIYTHAGPEIGVASTKAFTAQLIVLSMLALKIAGERGTIDQRKKQALVKELQVVPELIEEVLDHAGRIKQIAQKYWLASNFLYLGRGYQYPIAMEGALKLKEISYIHAEGYPAAEMKHGPIALIDAEMPIVVLALKDKAYDKVLSNIEEIKSRHGKVIAIISEGDEAIKAQVDDWIEIPAVLEYFAPLVSVVPLQLLAYHIGIMKGCNVDQPRNLAKSVTVE